MTDPTDGNEIDTIRFIHKAVFLSMVIFVFIFFGYFFVSIEFDHETMERDIFFHRLVFAMGEETDDRLGFGRIDLDKLNQEYLDSVIDYPTGKYGALIVMGNIRTYYNKEAYDKLLPRAGLEGAGGAQKWIEEIPVTYIENNKIKGNMMRIEMLRLNG